MPFAKCNSVKDFWHVMHYWLCKRLVDRNSTWHNREYLKTRSGHLPTRSSSVTFSTQPFGIRIVYWKLKSCKFPYVGVTSRQVGIRWLVQSWSVSIWTRSIPLQVNLDIFSPQMRGSPWSIQEVDDQGRYGEYEHQAHLQCYCEHCLLYQSCQRIFAKFSQFSNAR